MSQSLLISGSLYTPVAIGAALVALLLLAGRVPLSYNYYNLIARWRTTFLTVLAFTLVTTLLVAMQAVVNGMEALLLGSGRPGNIVIMAEGSTDEAFSNLGYSDVGELENQAGILRDGARPLVSRETYIIVTQPIENALPGRPKRRFLSMRGVDDPEISGRVHGLQLYEGGRWFSAAGVSDGAKGQAGAANIEVVVGEGLARELARDQTMRDAGKTALTVGDTFHLNDRTWIVVGIMKSEGLTFDSELWAKRTLIGPMFGKESYSSLVAQTAGVDEAAKLKIFFNNDYKKAAVNALIETDYYAGLSQTNKQFLISLIFLTVFMGIGGVFGVMNTMYAAVAQRTRDIGVLRLLGFNRPQVLISFLLESIMIALIGGALGCALGQLTDGLTANSVVSGGQGGGKLVVLRLTVNADTLAKAMLLALAMGILGGVLPAFQAVRLRILNALR
ncbi:MAG: ABC transporter permease [Planctomycetia bacterium]|nr:ABC transporter permease [Planctomycetia bacterium]